MQSIELWAPLRPENLEVPGSSLRDAPERREDYRGATLVIGLRCASAATVDVPIGPSSS